MLYKLHPRVLDDLIYIERSLGKLLGTIDLNNISLEERNFLADNSKEVDFSNEEEEVKNEEITIQQMKKDKNAHRFHTLST